MTNHPPSVLWHCWLGHQTRKNRRPYNLYCVGADVKPCSINHQLLSTKKLVTNSSWMTEDCQLISLLSLLASPLAAHIRFWQRTF